ncbi:hypothetical protein vseg_019309 [Gypsophila vaccaria]
MLRHIEWVSGYGSHLSVASVLGAVAVAIALRDGRVLNLSNLLSGLDRESSTEKQRLVPGLRNLGNNCFLNVVLQSLASCTRFRSYLDEVKELQMLSNDQGDDLPLFMSLAALLEEMNALQDRSRSLNPRKMMSTMQEYIPEFQLTNEQDSAEALLHLLSCLREELADCFMSSCGSLADVNSPTGRIISFKSKNNTTEVTRWRQLYLGPFDGVLSSFLTCRTCSTEILMDFDFFHSLPLSLTSSGGVSVPGRATLEDCIKRFLSPERVEYSCSHCWHKAAIKYLTLIEGKQEEICKLRYCVEQDICDCKKLSSLQTLPWSNRFSHTFKQLYIAHFPQILCLHLQRTSMNAFGEVVKIQGHVSFPLILDLSPFMKYEFGIQKRNVNESKGPVTAVEVKDEPSKTSPQWCSLQSGTDKVATNDSVPSKTQLYRLVSVVEHFGRAGSGHYTVYRGVRAQIEEGDVDGGRNVLPLQWFRISDSDVHHASEEDVLGADASLLFYERIGDPFSISS